jgi:hypothetical protein
LLPYSAAATPRACRVWAGAAGGVQI